MDDYFLSGSYFYSFLGFYVYFRFYKHWLESYNKNLTCRERILTDTNNCNVVTTCYGNETTATATTKSVTTTATTITTATSFKTTTTTIATLTTTTFAMTTTRGGYRILLSGGQIAAQRAQKNFQPKDLRGGQIL